MNFWLIVIGGVLVADTLLILLVSNVNMGVMLPAFLGAPILIYGLFYEKLYPLTLSGFGAVVKWGIVAVYAAYILITAAGIIFIEAYDHKKVDKGADAVIVLGAAVHGDKPSLTLMNRVDLALEYIEGDDEAVIVVSGGKGKQEQISEAQAARDYLISKGFPKERIIMEDRARDTYENFLYSKALLDERFGENGYTAVYTTNDFHVYRAGMAAKEAGLDIDGLGCGAKWYIYPNNYLREAACIFKYWIFGAR